MDVLSSVGVLMLIVAVIVIVCEFAGDVIAIIFGIFGIIFGSAIGGVGQKRNTHAQAQEGNIRAQAQSWLSDHYPM